jgi:hypothetical protein
MLLNSFWIASVAFFGALKLIEGFSIYYLLKQLDLLDTS